MPIINGLKDFVLFWNQTFIIDKWWRDKHKIAFGSSAHLEVSQIDILFEFLEQKIFDDYAIKIVEEETKKTLLKNGEWISEGEEPEMSDEDFDKIVISNE
jgi:hypothetical protein